LDATTGAAYCPGETEMKIDVGHNAFWILFWLIVASCTVSEEYISSQYQLSKIELALECAPDRRSENDDD